MPWQDNSGNNNGPTKGPWGQPPRGGGNGGGNGGGPGNGPGGKRRGDAPDLEELLQATRNRLKRPFPNGGGNGGRGGRVSGPPPAIIFGGGGLVIAILFLLSGLYQVGPQEQGVKTTFGNFAGISDPGLHWRIPIAQGVTLVPVDAQKTAVISGSGSGQENLMLTSDRNIVDVTFTVDYKISRAPTGAGEMPNAAKYIFNIDAPEQMVKAVAESAMRETIGAKELEPIITSGQADVVEQTRQRIQETLNSYDSGIEVLRVNMERPEVPGAVRDAFADVIKARNEKERMINEAQRQANQIIPVAEGEALKIIQEARAYAASVEADSLGQAERFNKIYREYARAPEVTRQRMYLETVESVLDGMNKVIIEDGSSGSGVVPYLPLNELQGSRRSNSGNNQ